PLERGTGLRVHGPPLRALLPGGARSVQHLALAAIEAKNLMGAPPVLPHHAVRVDGHAARTGQRRFVRRRHVHLPLTRLWRLSPSLEAHERRISGADSRAPQAPIDWADRIRITSEVDPVVLVGIDRLIRLGPLG